MRDQRARYQEQAYANWANETRARGTVDRKAPPTSAGAPPRRQKHAPMKKDTLFYNRRVLDLHHVPDSRLVHVLTPATVFGQIKAVELVVSNLEKEDQLEDHKRARQIAQGLEQRRRHTQNVIRDRRKSQSLRELLVGTNTRTSVSTSRPTSSLDLRPNTANAAAGRDFERAYADTAGHPEPPPLTAAEQARRARVERMENLAKPRAHEHKKDKFMRLSVCDVTGLTILDHVLEDRVNKVASTDAALAARLQRVKPLATMYIQRPKG